VDPRGDEERVVHDPVRNPRRVVLLDLPAAAVTGDPSENFSPGRMWNTDLPSFETAGNDVAASG
jgi:hypothetical protein